MPIVTYSNIYRITAVGVVLGQETINVFYYGAEAPTAPLADLADAFIGSVLTPVSGIMNSNASFTEVRIDEVRGGNAFYSQSVSIEGTNGGDCLPPYASWDFTFVRGGVGERNGYKRIAGVGEGNQANGVATSGFVSALGTAAAAMAEVLNADGDNFFPVIRRTRVHKFPQNPPVYYSISNVIYSQIGTQNSRKYGHGA